MTIMLPQISKEEAIYELARRKACKDFLSFVLWTWDGGEPYLVGRHTKEICNRITKAVDDYLAGKSTYLVVAVPFRHGKSQLVSIALPAYFLGRCAQNQPDVIMTGYGQSLVEGFSRQTRRIIEGDKYKALYPHISLQQGSSSVSSWQIKGSKGMVTATGLTAGLTGRGFSLGVVDDAVKSIEEARSKTYRESTWDAFAANFLTRRAPVSITIVCATPWHTDDIIGRIKQKNITDDKFPKFESLIFPATNVDGTYLFSERFSKEWYEGQYAALGKLSSGLLDCNPMPESGGRFDWSKVKLHKDASDFPNCREVRAWDLASTDNQRSSGDPDWTIGARVGVVQERNNYGVINHIYIKSIVGCRDEAPKRNELIKQVAGKDGYSVGQIVETYGSGKDTYNLLNAELRGSVALRPSRLPGDKSSKASILEAPWQAGNIHINLHGVDPVLLREMESQFSFFPSGKHDDIVDAVAMAVHSLVGASAGSAILGCIVQ